MGEEGSGGVDAARKATGNPNGQGESGMGEERRETVNFETLKNDLVKVAQDLGELIKEGLGEPGGKGLLGQLSRISEGLQEWKQEQEAKKAAKKGEGGERGKEAKAKSPEESEDEEEEEPSASEEEGGPENLFDGSEESFEKWKLVGSGNISCEEKVMHLEAGDDLGLAYFEPKTFDAGVLSMQFCPESPDCDAAVAVRFRNPTEPVPDRDDPETRYNYDNAAYVAAHTGFSVNLGSERPGMEPGTFEGVLIGDAPGAQAHPERGEVRPGEWNELEVEFDNECFAVRLNGKPTARFVNVDSYRGKTSEEDPSWGYVGVLLRKGRMRLKDVRFEVREASAAEEEEPTEKEAKPSEGKEQEANP